MESGPNQFPAGYDRRREPRHPASGGVEFFVEDPMPARFRGELMDWSQSGFRARHRHTELQSGQTVRFRHARASGQASVMWTRIRGAEVESGFLIR